MLIKNTELQLYKVVQKMGHWHCEFNQSIYIRLLKNWQTAI